MTWFDWEFEDKKGTKFVIKITAFDRAGTEQPMLRLEPKLDTWNSAKNIEHNNPDELPFY